ncbi:hypothetical protein ACET3X_000916 [Alternaria dauci]|uniref:RRM domain-containing protein n=1 Tax=Alternaria dauci TaxID=48095 RepID=A0ABR3UW52_9PLEO
MAQQIVVEALTRNVKEDHVREIFGKYGTIKDLRMPMNPTFNINRGIAYILYEEIDDAERAIAKMHDAQLDGAKIQVSIAHHRARTTMVVMDAVEEGPEVEVRLAHTDHDLWTDHRVIAPHHAACHPVEDTGVGEEVEVVVVDKGAMEDDPGHTLDLAADHHGEACRGPLTVGLYPEHHQDEAGEEATAGGIVPRGE